ncbi:MAG TPA: ZIP family metal transporter [Vicinamibacteria bacterium]|nr:ZIP family metal transporter [Vicinamibacteria bacterium]
MTLLWIVGGGLLMGLISLVGGATLFLGEPRARALVRPLVAFAAGSLLGGAFLHMLPAAVAEQRGSVAPYLWLTAGFLLFLGIEQFLHWHHCHGASSDCGDAVAVLVLVGGALHSFLGGLAVAAAFLLDVRVGISTWLAAAAHEVPRQFGDFGVLLHAGWSPRKALGWNLVSSLTFIVGGVLAWGLSPRMDTSWLLALAAGNFVYIGASDLVPEVNRHRHARDGALHFAAFLAGAGLLASLRLAVGE